MSFRLWHEIAWLVFLVTLLVLHFTYGPEILSIFTITFLAAHPFLAMLIGGLGAVSLIALFVLRADAITNLLSPPGSEDPDSPANQAAKQLWRGFNRW